MAVNLIDLEAEFIRYDTRREEVTVVVGDPLTWKPGGPTRKEMRDVQYQQIVPTLAEAQGVTFVCPLCYQNRGGRAGAHSVSISFAGRGVIDSDGSHNGAGEPTRWQVVSGTGLNDLVLSPSVHLAGAGCGWHGWVGTSGIPPGHAG